ncbi:hypothetical protein [Alicyclobacillus sp. ALC3]|uniref:hypothetical protein n=1 Tax=Alicyclobacillus sp. ALC3 TaxID=2796143 RepID=UPI002378593E|nr:hypothetical protein [Alicyclobacillus sp. ALC3]WDL98016.1 hypothetical protein JC200_04720 [Alicyclobacillus sp. ALC3]
MVWVVLIGVVLLILLGIVSFLQRAGELSRRVHKARELRGALSGTVLQLQTETDFSEAFRAGEAASLANQTAATVKKLAADFTSANRRLDAMGGSARFVPSLTNMVAVAEVIETYEDIEKRMGPVQQSVRQLSDLLVRASAEVSAVEQSWSAVKETIGRLLGGAMPASWPKQWQAVDALFTRISAELDDVKRAGDLAQVHGTVVAWESAALRLQTWQDWQQHGEERQKILSLCVQRLADQHGTATGTYRDLLDAATDVQHISALSAAEVADSALEPLVQRLRSSLTERINRATQLLNFLADPASRRERLTQMAARLRALRDSLQAPDTQSALDLAVLSDAVGATSTRGQMQQWLKRSSELLASVEQASTAANDEIAQADTLLQALAEGQEQKRALDLRAAAAKRALAEWGARLDALERAVADALKKLAAADLATHEEYQKWSGWQSDVLALRGQGATQDDARLRSLEARVEAEGRVVDALVASRQSVDEMLQQHLDQLVRRHGTDIPAPWSNRRGRVQQQLDTGDLAGATWSALAMAEALAEMSRYDGPGW